MITTTAERPAGDRAESRSPAYQKFLEAKGLTIQATVGEVEALARDLAAEVARLDPPAGMIVGLANGAFLPATIVAESLGLPCHMVKVRRKGSRIKQRLVPIAKALRVPPRLVTWGPLRTLWVFFQDRTGKLEGTGEGLGFDPGGRHVVMVDDCVETGNSFRYVADQLRNAGVASVRTAVFCWSRMPRVPEEQSRPTVYLHREIQTYPWSANTTQVGAFDVWMAARGLEPWK